MEIVRDKRDADDRSGARRVAAVSLAVAATVAVAKLVVGFATGSVAIISDGAHSTLDAGATGLTLFAVRLATKPPDREHPYGHGRAENLAALAQGFVMFVVAAVLAVESVGRLREPVVFEPPVYAIALVAGALVVDAWRARVLRRAAKRYASPALQADAVNFSADVLGSTAVLAGLVAARLGAERGDPAAALVVVLLVWVMAGRIAKSAVDVLMDRHPPELEPRLADAARAVQGVVEVPSLKIRRSGPHAHAEVTVTVGRTHSVERSHEIAEAVSRALAEAVPGTAAVVRIEPSAEGEDIVGRTFAAANRLGLADQVHNVRAIRHPEGLWLLLHAKVPPQTPLRRAHEITDELERELRREIDGLARVEIHLEPREPQAVAGRVVSAHREELMHRVRTIAESHPPIVRCHEVAVSQTPDGLHLVLHCEAPPDRPIAEIHDASLRVEDEIHRTFGEIRTVTVHFEPAAG